ncbi:cell division protein FtsB [Polynucleobacter sp. 30F-ANTBAC]|uniref:cell division protein FtsB n=1 Tax=Polynucleobacter sp. 30F-ANTBAC TaxID=2689095 RepID=UPI001C0BF367|nr:cell division protein FtsB [Polynucleobacter sp. 30F-ANTBAC]MBU3599232.1 cell division protein FtsB [Polynucleobacter sp. 30F-ANTBAC]
MRIVVYGMLALLVIIQYPLWLGKGGWLRVYELDRQVSKQMDKNEALAARNAKLSGEVKDLKDGTKAIEERARAEYGMSKEGEIFVQVVPGKRLPSDPAKDEARK